MSILDPTEEIRKIIIGAIVLALTATFGAIGGCEYKQRAWDKDKLAASEAARKLEKSDNSLGHRKIEQLGEDKVTLSEAQKWVEEAVKGAPKKLVSCGRVEVITSSAKNDKEPKIEEAPIPTFTRDFMQLYDVSINPSDVGLRGRSYETVPEIGVDEGFKAIERNNFKYNEELAKLKRLQERICEKQVLYKQPVSKFCQPS